MTPDSSVDCVFTNSLDHVFDLAKITSEISRVLKPGGYFVTELFGGYEEGFIAGDYEATHWRKARDFAEKLAALEVQVDELTAREARLVAERDGMPDIPFPADLLVRGSDPQIATLLGIC